MPARQTQAHWLLTHVVKLGSDECWIAHGGGYNKKGWHVAFKAEGARHLAHRAAWVQSNGPIPDGKFVLHRCDNPQCCNPAHLFLGTQSDNAKDMWAKKRGNAGHANLGRKLGPSPHRRLSLEQASEAIDAYAAGATQSQIAKKYGVTDVAISFILRGKTYEELKPKLSTVARLLGRGTKQKGNICA